jgi:hypothetical protein
MEPLQMLAAPHQPSDKCYFRIGAVDSGALAATAAKVSTLPGVGGCDGPRAAAKKTDIAIATPKLRIKPNRKRDTCSSIPFGLNLGTRFGRSKVQHLLHIRMELER